MTDLSELPCTDDDSGFGEVEEQHQHPNINDLPEEILIHIFLKVDSYSRRRAERVCTKWNNILVNSRELNKFVKLDRSLLPEQHVFSMNIKGIYIQFGYMIKYLGLGRKHKAECVFLTDESNPNSRGSLSDGIKDCVADGFFRAINQCFKNGLLQKPVRVIFHRVSLSYLAFHKPRFFPMYNICSIKLLDACLCHIVYQGFEYGPTPTRKLNIAEAEVDLRIPREQVIIHLWNIIKTKSEPLNAEEKSKLLDLMSKVQNNPDNVYRFRKIIAGLPWHLKPLPKPQEPIEESTLDHLSGSVQRELLNVAQIFILEERYAQWYIRAKRGRKDDLCSIKNRESRE